jgi:lipopolysaccharide exporter
MFSGMRWPKPRARRRDGVPLTSVNREDMTDDPAAMPDAKSATSDVQGGQLGGLVRRGLAWGVAGTIVLRFSSLAVGIALARLLTPSAFGVFAVALTVQSILMALADLGLSADLIRAPNPGSRAPTLATLGLCAGIVLTCFMAATAPPVAAAFGVPSAAPVMAVMSLTLTIAGAGLVPYSALTRDFKQRQLFAASASDFAVATVVTIGLVLLGFGPMALAIGRVAAQSVATTVQFRLAHIRPRFGFDRVIARDAIRFGLPLAGASVLSWALLNIDNVVVARFAGDVALGLYVLAFNVSNWPMSVIGQTLRSVALATFVHMKLNDDGQGDQRAQQGLITTLALGWAIAAPAGLLLAVLAMPLVDILYGNTWMQAAGVLAALGAFGALRVVLDVMATYLIACGASRPVLVVQIIWVVTLTPVMILVAPHFGIVGVGWAHLAVGIAAVLPTYCWALRRVGVRTGAVLAALIPPLLASLLAWFVVTLVLRAIEPPLLELIIGTVVVLTVYVAVLSPWLLNLRRRIKTNRQAIDDSETAASALHVQET